MADYDYLIKFLALGDSGVGKTSFLVCFCSSKLFFSIDIQTGHSQVNLYQQWVLILKRKKW